MTFVVTTTRGNPIIAVTEELLQQATAYERRVLAKIEHLPNYTGLSSANRYATGHICEAALTMYLDAHGILHRNLTNADGKPDHGDQEVYMRKVPLVLDVKGSAVERATDLLVGVEQWQRRVRHHDVLVGAHRRPRVIELMGWCWVQDFEVLSITRQLRTLTMLFPYERLTPMERLTRLLDRRPT